MSKMIDYGAARRRSHRAYAYKEGRARALEPVERAAVATPYRGVRRDGRFFEACLEADGKHRHIGLYRTAEEAARAYDRAAREALGEAAVLNFPAGRVGDGQ